MLLDCLEISYFQNKFFHKINIFKLFVMKINLPQIEVIKIILDILDNKIFPKSPKNNYFNYCKQFFSNYSAPPIIMWTSEMAQDITSTWKTTVSQCWQVKYSFFEKVLAVPSLNWWLHSGCPSSRRARMGATPATQLSAPSLLRVCRRYTVSIGTIAVTALINAGKPALAGARISYKAGSLSYLFFSHYECCDLFLVLRAVI